MSFVCALLVVIIHVWSPREIGSPAWWLYSLTSFRCIAVPYFFVAAGYFLAGHIDEPGWWKRENYKRIWSLVVPYCLWCVLWQLCVVVPYCLWCVLWQLCVVVQRIGANLLHDRPIFAMLGDLGWSTFLGIDLLSHPNLAPMWFVRTLLVYVAVSPVLVWAIKKFGLWSLVLPFIKLVFYKGEAFGTYHYFVDRFLGLGLVFYFMVGMAIRMGVLEPMRFKRDVLGLGGCCLLMYALKYGLKICMAEMEGWTGFIAKIVDRGVLGIPYVLANMYFIWLVMPSTKWPTWLTSMSFPIYIVHWWVLMEYGKWLYGTAASVPQLLARTSFGIVGSMLVVLLIRTLFGKKAGLLFGGR